MRSIGEHKIIQAKPGFHETLEYLLDIRQGAGQDLSADAPYTVASVGRGYTPCFLHADHASEFFSSNEPK